MSTSNWEQGKEQSDYHFDWLRHETAGHDYKWLARFDGDWTKELEEIILKAANAVGGGILGVDAMESQNGITVHEVNSTVEFRGAASISDIDISESILNFAINRDRR